MARIETDPNYTAPTFSRATATTDLFKATDVQSLAAAISTHRHNGVNTGLGVDPASNTIHAGALLDNTIVTAKLTDNSISNPKIIDGAVTSSKIPVNAIGTGHIQDGNVTQAKISAAAFDYVPMVPTANQGATSLVVSTILNGYSNIGLQRTAILSMQFTSAGPAGGNAVIQVRVPSAAQSTLNGIYVVHIGTFVYTTVGGTTYQGMAIFSTAVDLQFIATSVSGISYLGLSPNFQVQSGDRIGIMLPLYKGV